MSAGIWNNLLGGGASNSSYVLQAQLSISYGMERYAKEQNGGLEVWMP